MTDDLKLYDSINDNKFKAIIRTIRTTRDVNECIDAFSDVTEELDLATRKFSRFNSAHEGYAVLLEEVDELWEHVKMKQSKRDIIEMRKEAIQIAAMAIRFAVDICNDKDGRR